MKDDSHPIICCLVFFFFFFRFLGETTRADNIGEKKSVYIVYTGAATSSTMGSSRETHIQLLASVLQRREHAEKRFVHAYSRGFSGCAVWLTKAEAHLLSKRHDVVSVFVDPIYQLHTTRSWDFLQYDLETFSNPRLDSASLSDQPDTIIGILDTGIWPESDSFNDKGMGPIPSRWKGVCMEGHDFQASKCNRKLIGARYYNASDNDDDSESKKPNDEDQTARDIVGHGTHTASTAAGISVPGASYYGLAEGTAKGGSPGSRIAVYRVCMSSGCRGSAILAAFDDAISDGVDVLSLSLGAAAYSKPDFSTDPIAIGSFHAVEKGITVICSAGNDGPTSSTVVNAAPWILTVAATTIDRDFESDIVLGGNIVVKGEGINFSNLKSSPTHQLIHGKSAKSSVGSNDDASKCFPSALNGDKINGKIVLCDHSDDSYSKKEIRNAVKELGGIGLIFIDNLERSVASPSGDFPMTVVSSKEAADILSYINSTKTPTATILPTVTVNKFKPAPVVAYFSSRGPSSQTENNLLKPDVAAPGVNILAAWIQTNKTEEVPAGKKPTLYNLISGTSMSCPHVSGIAATIKSMNPSWSPSAIKSAIMTTATQTNNEKLPMMTDSGSKATPYDYGAGEVSPTGALQPGLVYEATTNDYLQFLCNYGYSLSTIKLITAVQSGFRCSDNSSTDLISELNYPTIAISQPTSKGSKSVTRTVRNVGADDETTYTVSVISTDGVNVQVKPEKLEFTKAMTTLSYQVVFSTTASSPTNNDLFGSLTWSNGKYGVRTPFVVSATS
ncbi:Subtilisin-like protease [Thalictrum thalictroides]|uniref:Subtilisin-like protease n=1 Tax=Thalictrum thalictroides TaxID=46969 RepID=A0A7J6WWK0_THATH|nr:Subtilisin-like protease [Thalictrum thalictroides]